MKYSRIMFLLNIVVLAFWPFVSIGQCIGFFENGLTLDMVLFIFGNAFAQFLIDKAEKRNKQKSKIRLSRFDLWMGISYVLVFCILLIYTCSNSYNLLSAVILSGEIIFMAIGICLIASYFNCRIVIAKEEITYRTMFRKEYNICKSEIIWWSESPDVIKVRTENKTHYLHKVMLPGMDFYKDFLPKEKNKKGNIIRLSGMYLAYTGLFLVFMSGISVMLYYNSHPIEQLKLFVLFFLILPCLLLLSRYVNFRITVEEEGLVYRSFVRKEHTYDFKGIKKWYIDNTGRMIIEHSLRTINISFDVTNYTYLIIAMNQYNLAETSPATEDDSSVRP